MSVLNLTPIPVAARSKAWVSCRSLAGIAASNPTAVVGVRPFECWLLSGR